MQLPLTNINNHRLFLFSCKERDTTDAIKITLHPPTSSASAMVLCTMRRKKHKRAKLQQSSSFVSQFLLHVLYAISSNLKQFRSCLHFQHNYPALQEISNWNTSNRVLCQLMKETLLQSFQTLASRNALRIKKSTCNEQKILTQSQILLVFNNLALCKCTKFDKLFSLP